MRASHAFLVCSAILALLVAFLVASRAAGAAPRRAGADGWDDGIESFVRRRVAGAYVDALDPEAGREAFYRAMKAYVDFDRYCAFYTPAERREWEESTSGRYGGLGIKIDPVAEGLHLVGVFPGGPADRAGLRVGDTLVSADGRSLAGLDIEGVTRLLKGPPRTVVRVGVVRGPRPESGPLTGETREVPVTREDIRPPTVFARRVGPDRGTLHLRLTDFAEESADAFDRAIDAAVAEGGLQGVVLDLRDNGGGVLGVAVRVVDRFLAKGLVVRMQGRTADANRPYAAAPQANDLLDTPLVVLINAGSASASEVVAGALQDHRRAVLVGERSFGKFLVQTITEIPGTRTAVKLTTSRYYTPLGRSYQGQPARAPHGAASAEAGTAEPAGLIPDVVVPLEGEDSRRLREFWGDEEGRPWGQAPRHPENGVDWIDPQLEQALKLLEGEMVLRKIERRDERPRNG
jgi:carboxyl-terminal processing protease